MGTPVKYKKKIPRHSPFYFKTRKSTTVKQERPKTPTEVPITIEGPPSKKEEMGPYEGEFEEVTSPKPKPNNHIAYVRRPTTKSTSFKQPETSTNLKNEEQRMLREKEIML